MKKSAERLFVILTTEICANNEERRLAALKAIGKAWFIPQNTWKNGSRGCVTLTAASGASGRAVANFDWFKPGNDIANELCLANKTLNEATALWDNLSWTSRILLHRKIRLYVKNLEQAQEISRACFNFDLGEDNLEKQFTL